MIDGTLACGVVNLYKPAESLHFKPSASEEALNVKVRHAGTLIRMRKAFCPYSSVRRRSLRLFGRRAKEYLAEILWDFHGYGRYIGRVTCVSDYNIPYSIRSVYKGVYGRNHPKPPIYSAIKVEGRKLYEYARKCRG